LQIIVQHFATMNPSVLKVDWLSGRGRLEIRGNNTLPPRGAIHRFFAFLRELLRQKDWSSLHAIALSFTAPHFFSKALQWDNEYQP
jgi:hypothetical protein